ncbi:MAG: DUF790 family protein [Verrucomicrobiota bacterium]|nr:DUF790 family protein [Verrucomicrobiota bacterium]
MLTRGEAWSEVKDGRVVSDTLTSAAHGHYVGLAEEMLSIYREGVGQSREELHRSVEELFYGEQNCPPQRIRAFRKLLDAQSEFDGARGDDAAQLRMRVFKLAAPRHPLVVEPQGLLERKERDVKNEIGKALGEDWPEIERRLFSDVVALHRLTEFRGYASPEALLRRYNEAQLQAVLYDATEMRIHARTDYRHILAAVKLAQLMYTAERRDDGFEFIIDGPVSVLRETKRYGVHMAGIIPTLLACKDWNLTARIKKFARTSWQPELVLRSGQYHSSLDGPTEFDSKLERTFMAKWGSGARDGWRLLRESEPRFILQKAIFPDFTFEHETGVRVLFEIVGFWRPEYLSAKRESVQQLQGEPLLLAVRDDAVEDLSDFGIPIVPFKSSLKLEPVQAALTQFVRGT